MVPQVSNIRGLIVLLPFLLIFVVAFGVAATPTVSTTSSNAVTDNAIPETRNLGQGQLDATLEASAIPAHYYLAHWEWVTEDQDGETVKEYWAAPHGDKLLGLVDLRPLPAQGKREAPEGYGFFSYNQKVDGIPGAIYLGDALDASLVPPQKEAVKEALAIPGPSLKSSTVGGLLWDVLTEYSDPTGQTAPRPLRGKRGEPVQLYLGGHGIIRQEPFTEEHRQRTIEVFQADYRRNKQAGVPLEALQRWTGSTMQALYGKMDDQTAQIILPQEHKQDRWKRPETTINESWDCAISASLNCNLIWVEFTNTNWQILNNVAHLSGVSGANALNLARADHNLSSDDHYAQAVVATLDRVAGGDIQAGPIARKDANATETFYRWVAEKSGGAINGRWALKKRINGTTTDLQIVAQTFVANDLARVTANDSTISGKVNGIELASSTDTSITGILQTGIWGFGSDTTNIAKLDNFEGADIAPPPLLKAENGKIRRVSDNVPVRLRGVHLFDFTHKYEFDSAAQRELRRLETAIKPSAQVGWGANLFSLWVDTHPVLNMTNTPYPPDPGKTTYRAELRDAVSTTTTTFIVQNETGTLPTDGDVVLGVQSGTSEVVSVDSVVDNGDGTKTWTVTRALTGSGTTAQAWPAATPIHDRDVVYTHVDKNRWNAHLNSLVDLANTHGAYILLTWHNDNGRQTHTKLIDANGTEAMRVLAQTYANNPSVIFACQAEPPSGITWTQLKTACETTIDQIRTVYPSAMVGIPGVNFSNGLLDMSTDPPARSNIFGKPHNYRAMPYTVVNNGNDSVIAGGFPVVVGEFGPTTNSDPGEPAMTQADAEDLVRWAEGKPDGVAGYVAWALTHEGCVNNCMFVDAATDNLTPWGVQTRDLLLSPPSGPDPLPGVLQIVQEIKSGGNGTATTTWWTQPVEGRWLFAFVNSGVGTGGTVTAPAGWTEVVTVSQDGRTSLYAKKAASEPLQATWQILGEPIVVTLLETTGLDESLTLAQLVDVSTTNTSLFTGVNSFTLGPVTTTQADVVLMALIAGQRSDSTGKGVAYTNSFVEATYNIGLAIPSGTDRQGWHSVAARTVTTTGQYSVTRSWIQEDSRANGILVALRVPTAPPPPPPFQIVQQAKAGGATGTALPTWNIVPVDGRWLLAFVNSGVDSSGAVVAPSGWVQVATEPENGRTSLYAKKAASEPLQTTWQILGEPINVTLWETTGLDQTLMTVGELVNAVTTNTSGFTGVTSFTLGPMTTTQANVVLVALFAGQTIGGSANNVTYNPTTFAQETYNIEAGDGWHAVAVRTVGTTGEYSVTRTWSTPDTRANGIFVALRLPPGS